MLRPTALVVVPLLLLGSGCTTKAELSTPERANGAAAATASPRVGAERNETDEAYVHELSAMHQQAISMSDLYGLDGAQFEEKWRTGWPPTTGPPWRCRGPRSTGG